MSQAISGKANLYSLLYLPPSSLTIPRWVKNFTADRTPPGGGQNTSIQVPVSYPKNHLAIALVIIFPKTVWTHLLNDLHKFPS